MSELLTIGEPLTVFESCDLDLSLSKASHFDKYLAGAECNVAIGVARLQHSVDYVSSVGNDPFGIFIRKSLQQNNISDRYLFNDSDHWTGFYLKQRVSHGSPGIYYYRNNSAASNLTVDEIEQIDLNNTKIAHLTGIFPALSKFSYTAYKKLNQRLLDQGILVTFDPNLRPSLWESQAMMIQTINDLARNSNIVLPGINEGQILMGSTNPEEIADYYLNQSEITKMVVVKLGPQGAFVKEKGHKGHTISGFKVDHVADTVGAGDGFAVGLISALLEDLSINQAIKRACAIGALAVQSYGDNDGYPTHAQLNEFYQQY